MPTENIILNIGSLLVGVTIAANLILGFLIYFRDSKSHTNRLFLLQTLALSAWSVLNYSAFLVTSISAMLLLSRLALLFAVPNSIIFLFLMRTFPEKKATAGRFFTSAFVALGLLTMAFALSPWMLVSIRFNAQNLSLEPVFGQGIALFALAAVLTIPVGIFYAVKRLMAAKGLEQVQMRYILTGVTLTFGLILVLNFLLPAIFDNTRFIPFSVIYTLPFVLFTALAIIRHKLLDVKILSTEILVFMLAALSLFEVLTSGSVSMLFFRISVFLMVLAFGILLIRSVIQEVQQREKLEALSQQLKNTNTKLKETNETQSDFLSIASHQLRTPPATIKWYLSAILNGDFGKLNEELFSAIQKTQATNNDLISLIDDLLNVSRIERGKIEYWFEEVDLEELTAFAVEQLTPIALEKHLKLEFIKPAKKLPYVVADKEKLKQVINNLIDNALKYTDEGGAKIELVEEKNRLRFKITDTGKGITPEEQKLMFQKFSRGKNTGNHTNGLGLGLYVAKIIIAKHDGKIWAESPGAGKGTSFFFTLPLNSQLKAQAPLVPGKKV